MIWIYTDSITNRLRYTLDFIFTQRGISYQIADDVAKVTIQHGDSLLNYSCRELSNACTIFPAKLLEETGVSEQKIEKERWQAAECLSFNEIADPIASIFYVLTRYEEYLPFQADEHDRFGAKNSMLSQCNWIYTPICDVWAEAIIHEVEKACAAVIPIRQQPMRIVPTFDIDNTFAYKHKSGLQLWGAIVKDVLKLNFKQLKLRRHVRLGKTKDPFDTFDFILSLVDKNIQPLLFWHLGDLAPFDRNLPWEQPNHQLLIQQMASKLLVGIHPSYQSNLVASKVKTEALRLETITGKQTIRSRQHFLKLTFPQTYENLIAAGIQHDYSMGFADSEGFRMGTARSIPFFNVRKNEVTTLELHPFVYMDGTLNQYKKYAIGEAQQVVEQLANQVKRYGGDFAFIWHNETIGETGRWIGWKEVFETSVTLS